MSYVGGLGGGRGWLTSTFLISPDELAALLSLGKVLVYTRAAVPKPFRPLSAAGFVDAYRRYLRLAHAGEPLPTDVTRSLSHEFSRVVDVYRVRPTKFDPKNFVVVDVEQPVVGFNLAVSPLPPLRKGARAPLALVPLGLEISYPKVVSLREREGLVSTEGTPNRALFDEMAAWVKARTRPVTLVRGKVVKRTQVRVSDGMREWLETHPTMRAYRTYLR